MNDPVSVPKLHRWHRNAELAADAFALPEDWELDRGEPVDGYLALTPKIEAGADTAFGVTTDENSDMLHVSAADAGTFLSDVRPLRKYAERRTRVFEPGAKERGRSGFLVPPGIGWYALGFTNEVARPAFTLHIPIQEDGAVGPATLTRDVIRARQLTYNRAAAILEGNGQVEENRVGLEGLKRVSGVLAAARGADEAATPEAIVREAVTAAEQALGAFMQANNIPGLYRASVVPSAMLDEKLSPQPSDLGAGGVQALWAAPLHEFASFVNHCNVAAFMNGRTYPYPQDRLDKMARQYNRNALEGKIHTLVSELQEEYEGAWQDARFSATELRSYIERSSVDPLDLAVALFAASGRMSEIRTTQEVAARFIAASPHLARLVLGVALSHNALVMVEPQPDDANNLLFSDGAHETYPYGDEETFGLMESDIAFIGRVAGIENLKPGMKQLSTAVKTANARAKRPAAAPAARTAKRAPAPRTTRTPKPPKAAKKPAAGQPNPPGTAQARREQAFANPRIALHARMETAGCKAPEFSFDSPGECVASVIDADGTPYTVAVPGNDDIATRNRAAAALLAQLPPRPLNKRGDMWRGHIDPAGETE